MNEYQCEQYNKDNAPQERTEHSFITFIFTDLHTPPAAITAYTIRLLHFKFDSTISSKACLAAGLSNALFGISVYIRGA